ncbi:hypothetical protein CYLTODRAFT_460305 [Cylindrobasidium torrendii FP15055 ss-10]|uniref:Uncharacterized protein n=1 Tax=Cylindrobasidium torrendii FP15055 ss-10 TaxID=1314674 RepID=A0A0D7ASB7_9AGAR|nr:hypothetical protein CYLTODRAFT_460305 [Cylindrobasidium torrendii FP15055 ss-10]
MARTLQRARMTTKRHAPVRHVEKGIPASAPTRPASTPTNSSMRRLMDSASVSGAGTTVQKKCNDKASTCPKSGRLASSDTAVHGVGILKGVGEGTVDDPIEIEDDSMGETEDDAM